MRRIAVCWLIVIALLVSSMAGMAQQGGYFEGFEAGRAAAQQNANGTAQFAGGFFLGLFYLAYAALAPGQAPTVAYLQTLSNQPEEYQRGFLEGHEQEWKRKRTNNALLGTGTAVAAYFVFYIALIAAVY